MIDGKAYVEVIELYFSFLITEFGFQVVAKTLRGNVFYDVQYKYRNRIISISYENIEDYLQVILFMLHDGKLPHYDGKTKTLHLSWLNEVILPKVQMEQIISNNKAFSKFIVNNELEKMLLKSAKELRLCLLNFDEFVL